MPRAEAAALDPIFETVHYREFKILLKREAFLGGDPADPTHDFWKRARRIADEAGVAVEAHRGWREARRRVVRFWDTDGGDLYGRSWILRTRTDVVRGAPAARYELTLKFRHPEVRAAARADLHVTPPLDGEEKLKEELLLVEEHLGGMRSIFSHGCQLKDFTAPPPTSVADAAKIFPALAHAHVPARATLSPVGTREVEEVLFCLGGFDFGHGRWAKVDLAVWRDVASGEPLIGEFAYETHFQHYGRFHPAAKQRSERFYRLLQREAGSWVELGATKTALVYQLAGRRTSHRE